MDVQLLVVPNCPNAAAAVRQLRDALDELGQFATPVAVRVIDSQEEADRCGFIGSPTILINGADPFAQSGAPPGVACRIYRTPAGTAGIPETAVLREALRAAENGSPSPAVN